MSNLLQVVIDLLVERFGFNEVWKAVTGSLDPEEKLARAHSLEVQAMMERNAAEIRKGGEVT